MPAPGAHARVGVVKIDLCGAAARARDPVHRDGRRPALHLVSSGPADHLKDRLHAGRAGAWPEVTPVARPKAATAAGDRSRQTDHPSAPRARVSATLR